MTKDELTMIHDALRYGQYGDRDRALEIINRELELKKLEENPNHSDNELSQR